ncbi:MAG: hypothetical protein COB92_04745 [Robiginitomaculum sp.]|nr:MAG: hypothetical protein COB92_04745 [Robiginitomaculum sp.]
MSKSQLVNTPLVNTPLANTSGQIKTIHKLEARIRSLHKAVAALPPLCDCEAKHSHGKYTHGEELALAEKLAGLWEQEFEQELRTGIRASMNHLAPSKAKTRD